MFVVGFQEIVPLSAKNVMTNKNSSQIQYWDQLITDCLNDNTEFHQDSDKYVKIRSDDMVGLYIGIFVKRCLRPHIKEIACSKIKLGRANLANKGSVCLRFKYKESTLSFGVCHLESGQAAGLDVTRRQ